MIVKGVLFQNTTAAGNGVSRPTSSHTLYSGISGENLVFLLGAFERFPIALNRDEHHDYPRHPNRHSKEKDS